MPAIRTHATPIVEVGPWTPAIEESAVADLIRWATNGDGTMSWWLFEEAFAIVEGPRDQVASYRYPHHVVRDGQLVAPRAALEAAWDATAGNEAARAHLRMSHTAGIRALAGQATEPVRQVRLLAGEARHVHAALLDEQGNGTTSLADGHRHDVAGGRVLEAQGHTHLLVEGPALTERQAVLNDPLRLRTMQGCGSALREAKVDRVSRTIRNVAILGEMSDNGNRYPIATMREAAGLYEGAPAYLNHARDSELTDRRGARDVKDLVGSYSGVAVMEGKLRGDMAVLAGPDGDLLLDIAERMPQIVGLSHEVSAHWHVDDGLRVVDQIVHVASVDVVDRPATNDSLFEGRGMVGSILEGRGVPLLVTRESMEDMNVPPEHNKPTPSAGDDKLREELAQERAKREAAEQKAAEEQKAREAAEEKANVATTQSLVETLLRQTELPKTIQDRVTEHFRGKVAQEKDIRDYIEAERTYLNNALAERGIEEVPPILPAGDGRPTPSASGAKAFSECVDSFGRVMGVGPEPDKAKDD